MSSTYTVSPKSLHDLGDHPQGRTLEPHLVGSQNNYNQGRHITPVDSNLLSAYSSQVRSNTASPDANSYTPAESVSYQPSDYSSELTDDPFFGANFNDVETGTPAFLDELFLDIDYPRQSVAHESPAEGNATRNLGYPISPRKSPSIHTTSSPREKTQAPPKSQVVVATRGLTKPPGPSINPADSEQSSPQLTPDTNGSGWSRSSTDSPAPVPAAMADQSPRVTVSIYGRDGEQPVQGVERHLSLTAESPKTVRGPHSLADDSATELAYGTSSGAPRDAQGFSNPNWTAGPRGLAPGDRPPNEVISPNQQAARREIDEKNQEIFNWVSGSNDPDGDQDDLSPSGNAALCSEASSTPYANEDNIPEREIPLGNATENRHQPGQSYFQTDGPGGPVTETDFTIMRQLRTWEDAPAIHSIQTDRRQPETSQAAIQRFMQQHHDTASIVSRTATWGTRRRSLPSVMDERGVLSGNFLKKLSIGAHSRRPSIRERAEKLIRLPSMGNSRKRRGSGASDLPPEDLQAEEGRRESRDSLASPSRTTSWGLGGNRKPTPSLGNALVEMARGAAAVGTTHARTGSISATPVTSPKSPFSSFSGSLKVPPVKNTIRRSRSKTEVSSRSGAEGSTHPNLVGMLKRQGGPPVALLAKSRPAVDEDEDEDEDDDVLDDADVNLEAGKLEDITPNAEGFKQHILRLNPRLASIDGQANPNTYLVERIAYQQLARYKHLCAAKVKHLGQVSQRKCPSGAMCIASGGSAVPLDNRGDARGVDPLSARPDSSDGDTSPLDGGISSESFPQGIPMPPTMTLPAEFECQLCFSNKKFHKPSDWTKHVHEDVQPFTCTWDRCKEPKMFKRKADWVRHENEGHRHLEWWTCDVEDCRHTCYRRDNFLQHLVREHKFTEPKVKTKAAIKKAGGGDRTWQRVEQCHVETDRKPQDEPCRFCDKTFPTWKKLTVHLAKHMEHISLPVLKLVAARELEADTVISPVQDPPPRPFGPPPVPVIKQEPPLLASPGGTRSPSNASPLAYHDEATFGFTNIPRAPLQASYYTPQTPHFAEVPSHQGNGLMMPQVTTGTNPQSHYQHIPVTTGPYGQPVGPYMNLPNQGNFHTQGPEPFPPFDPLGIQDPSGPMAYGGFADSSLQQRPMERYSNQGSVSPYAHSSHQGHTGYYNP